MVNSLKVIICSITLNMITCKLDTFLNCVLCTVTFAYGKFCRELLEINGHFTDIEYH